MASHFYEEIPIDIKYEIEKLYKIAKNFAKEIMKRNNKEIV